MHASTICINTGLGKAFATRGEVPPTFGNFPKLGGRRGGFFFENYKFYMPHFGLIKLESSNLLDITTDAF